MLSCHKDTQVLEYQILAGRCTSEQVEAYLESLAQQAQQQQIPVTVVLDNVGFHKAKRINSTFDLQPGQPQSHLFKNNLEAQHA